MSRRLLRTLRGDDRGATAVEYALIAALIAVVVMCFVLIVAIPVLGLAYGDLVNATQLANAAAERAVQEAAKLRELRKEILKERQDAD